MNYEDVYESGRRLGQPRTEEERMQQHYQRYGTTTLPPRGTGLQARGQVVGVPDWALPYIESAAYVKGVYKSWLAAVCERTGWDLDYLVNNYIQGRGSGITVRQFGLAGVWGDIPEIPVTDYPSGWCYTYKLSQLGSGWFPLGFRNIWFNCKCIGGYTAGDLDIQTNINLAADILKNSGDWVKGICGEYNELVFMRWQLGCHWYPEVDLESGECIIPPGLPGGFKQEMQNIVAAQKIYSEIFSEPPIGVAPISVSLSANRLAADPGVTITFTANAIGGAPPYVYTWDFGDGATSETQNPVVGHAYEAEGVYQAQVAVTDRLDEIAVSSPLSITIEEGAGGGGIPSAALWGLLGLAGLVGVMALGKKGDKREQARKLRQQAAALRQQAATLRAEGKNQQAAAVEARATELERKATQIEAEATREEQEKARREAEKYAKMR